MSARSSAAKLLAPTLLGSVVLVGALDQSMLVVAVPEIGLEFSTTGAMGLVVSVYVVAATIATPCFGAIANRVGAGPSLIAALALFLLGSIACALAPSFPGLLAGRALQGMAAGGLGTGAQLLAVERMPVSDRAWLQSAMSMVIMVAGLGGPLLGLLLLEHTSWRMLFWINVPVLLIQFLLLDMCFNLSAAPTEPTAGVSFDTIGMLVFAVFVLSLLFCLAHLSGALSDDASLDTAVALPVVGGVLGASAGVLWRRGMVRENAFIPLRTVGRRVWGVAAVSFAHFAVLTALPLALTIALHGAQTQLLARVLVTFTSAVPVGAFIAGLWIRRGAPPLRLMALGAAALAISLALAWSLLDGQTSRWILGVALAGLAAGLAMPAAMIAAQMQAPAAHMKSATYLIACCRSLGGACAAIVAGSTVMSMQARPPNVGTDASLPAAHLVLAPVLAFAASVAAAAALGACALLRSERGPAAFGNLR